MPTSKIPDLFSPFLGAVIAASTSPSGIVISLGLALFGGAAGWLGKYLAKSLFTFIKEKRNEIKG